MFLFTCCELTPTCEYSPLKAYANTICLCGVIPNVSTSQLLPSSIGTKQFSLELVILLFLPYFLHLVIMLKNSVVGIQVCLYPPENPWGQIAGFIYFSIQPCHSPPYHAKHPTQCLLFNNFLKNVCRLNLELEDC